jgi:hypothetical protein
MSLKDGGQVMDTRIAMYVDGWNMLGSMKGANIRKYGWCDFELLAKQRTGHTNAVVTVKFFTSWDTPNRNTPLKKQEIWWRALELKGWEIIKGRFGSTSDEVEEWYRNSGKQWREKMTDVHLASRLIADCARIEPVPGHSGDYRWKPKYDEAVLLTQDTDFVPAVRIAHEEFRGHVHVLLPPSEPQAQRNVRVLEKGVSGANSNGRATHSGALRRSAATEAGERSWR